MSKIGLLTGTFDPIHLGHVALAQAAMRACALDEVWFLVNADPAHKLSATPYSDRLAMVELAIAGQVGLQVYLGPQAEAPHVISTFEAIESEYPGSSVVYILGADTFARLDRWQDVQSVVTNASYAVAFRLGTPRHAIADLKLRLGELAGRLHISQFEFDDHGLASSTDIRRKVRAGERSLALDPRVQDYIASHQLYGLK
jgi:nicotinate-nucleotide adenylyltransferase